MIISTEFENTHYGVQEAAGSNPVTRTIKSPEYKALIRMVARNQ